MVLMLDGINVQQYRLPICIEPNVGGLHVGKCVVQRRAERRLAFAVHGIENLPQSLAIGADVLTHERAAGNEPVILRRLISQLLRAALQKQRLLHRRKELTSLTSKDCRGRTPGNKDKQQLWDSACMRRQQW